MRWLLVWWLAVVPLFAFAQDFSGLARLDVAQSVVAQDRRGIKVDLFLSQPVPYRVFTLDDPRRLILDFREVDWRGASKDQMLQTDRAADLRFGVLRPGWSRMVVDLAAPFGVTEAGMTVSQADGTARLTVRLAPQDAAAYAAAAGAPPDPAWQALVAADPTLPVMPPVRDGTLTVVIDPGHGGVDPGAERDGMVEADVMLAMARELAEAINRTEGMRAVLTREADVFVPLEQRMTIARSVGADAFLSMHADALEMDGAEGASVYTLSAEALDQASARMAERHDRGDLLAGVDLRGQDDTVATVLMDLARLETAPKSLRLADFLVAGMDEAGATLNSRPRREAVLAVLNAADFPSVLIEVGFLSNAGDRARLATTEGRAPVVDGIVIALRRWAVDEAARAPLIRQ